MATACGTLPTGQPKWTAQLLADSMVEPQQADTLSDETVRRTLKNNLKP